MLIFKKEKKVVELALKHAETTGESLTIMIAAIKDYASGELHKLPESTAKVDALESAADGLLRDIRELLYSGAYLPTIRGDIYRLLSRIDSITNNIEHCVDFVNYRKPALLDIYQSEIGEILDLTGACFAELQKALRAFFKPKGKVEELRAHAREVAKLESSIDERELALTLKIFESQLTLAEKQQLALLLDSVTEISDEVENAADELELLSLKSIV